MGVCAGRDEYRPRTWKLVSDRYFCTKRATTNIHVSLMPTRSDLHPLKGFRDYFGTPCRTIAF